jgi:SOS-response transcriptional repressor LexA
MPTFIPPPLLSRRQSQLIEAIERFEQTNGYRPSMREVARVLGLAPSRVQQLATSTEAKGALVRVPGVARSWRVVKPASKGRAAR